jgi:hypothetical protein
LIFAVALTAFSFAEQQDRYRWCQNVVRTPRVLTTAAAPVNFAFYGLIFALSLFFQHA